MAERVKFSSIAQKELEDSSEWYEEQASGLGVRFAFTIYKALTLIAANPKAYPQKRSPYRESVIDKISIYYNL
jgi:hypothetical protein